MAESVIVEVQFKGARKEYYREGGEVGLAPGPRRSVWPCRYP